jgi:hypothetical protein
MNNITLIAYLRDRLHELERENEELKDGRCRFNCRTAKEAFLAGFDAGMAQDIKNTL